MKISLGPPFSEGLHHKEIKQLICDADRMTGFWIVRVFAETCLQTDSYYL